MQLPWLNCRQERAQRGNGMTFDNFITLLGYIHRLDPLSMLGQ